MDRPGHGKKELSELYYKKYGTELINKNGLGKFCDDFEVPGEEVLNS